MSDLLANSSETQHAKRWRLRHSLVLGLSLGMLIVVANQINNWRSREHILGMRGLPSGLLLSDVEAFERFKHDLAFQYEGRPAFPIVDAVHSSLLQAEFPDHFFVQVFVEYKFFGITVARPYLHQSQIWAISRRRGPNFCFSRGSQTSSKSSLFWEVLASKSGRWKTRKSCDESLSSYVALEVLPITLTGHIGKSPNRFGGSRADARLQVICQLSLFSKSISILATLLNRDG